MASSSSSQPNAIGSAGDRNQEKEDEAVVAAAAAAAAEAGNGSQEDEAVVAAAAAAEAGNGSQLVMPEDGYEWKKYGQKFIKNIQKIRSYFRCRHRLCGAKKKVEWHPSDPSGALRVVYEGAHQHGSPPSSSAAAAGGASNKYELGAQYFGGARPQ
ncbi:hypothetical protein PAHAL_9G145800 [Panicum hallii]|uniref:WRKY domain-containing protein n=1 Tax=Panicum hallii TaxID=206008 RepID=A0A2S3IJM0_9POAL|nr:WRKY transcription factor 23-like isoform X3 [Panicum hallii]PAN45829.1 hypothetical protein PAHAL_9G145800 [Panicum hallii]